MIPDKPRHRFAAAGCAALLVAIVAGCGGGATGSPGGPIRVVAAENTWGDIAAHIGGSAVTVTSIITDPAADPHIYESSPADAAAINDAGVVIENGAGYDDFIDNLLGASGNASRKVVNVATVVGAGSDNPNPHFWYSPTDVTTMARTIASTFGTIDHAHASMFQSNLTAFLDSYARYRQVITEIATRHPHARVAYTERVAGYLVQSSGMVLVSPVGFAQSIEDGSDPAPGDVVAMDATLADHQASLLLYNAQVTSPATAAVRALATSSGIPVVGVAETIPAGEPDFVSWQVAEATAILTALGG